MAFRKSPSVARSAPRAERCRVAHYAARLDEELHTAAQSALGSLEGVMGPERLLAVGKTMREFAAGVTGKGQVAGRDERLILPSANFPPMA